MCDRICKGCWWEEGGRCYIEPCTRQEDGRSTKLTTGRCNDFLDKRQALCQIIPTDMLIITSEGRNQK